MEVTRAGIDGGHLARLARVLADAGDGDFFHHNEILQDIFSKYGNFIVQSDIFVGLGFVKFPRTYLVDKQNEFQKFAVSGGTTEKIKLSEISAFLTRLPST